MEPSALLTLILDAFPVKPTPEMTLYQGQLADQSMAREISEAEWDAEGNKDRHTPWTGYEIQDLANCQAALAHLDEEAFGYYLPAFLSFAVRYGRSENFTHINVVSTALHVVTELSNHNRARLKKLTGQQIDAVIAFLRFVSSWGGLDSELAKTALRLYWETPDARHPKLIQAP
jgi:hypothetical protein